MLVYRLHDKVILLRILSLTGPGTDMSWVSLQAGYLTHCLQSRPESKRQIYKKKSINRFIKVWFIPDRWGKRTGFVLDARPHSLYTCVAQDLLWFHLTVSVCSAVADPKHVQKNLEVIFTPTETMFDDLWNSVIAVRFSFLRLYYIEKLFIWYQ